MFSLVVNKNIKKILAQKIAKKNGGFGTIYDMIKIKINEVKKSSPSIWKMVSIGKAATPSAKTGKLSQKEQYAVIHVPSGMKIPTDFYKSTRNDVKALIQFLNTQSWPDINSPNPSEETIDSIHDMIIDSEFARPTMKYTKIALNEALEGLALPDILNTKVMEDVTINAKAQEVYGRFVRDWLLNWGSNNLSELTRYINFGVDDTKIYFRHIFFRFYKNNGGDPKELVSKKDYYAFTPRAWSDRLGDINMTGLMPKKMDQWRKRFTMDIDPGKGNTIDREIYEKTMDQFIDLRLYMQDQGRLWYPLVGNTDPTSSIDSKGNNYSAKWSKMRKILKSVRKYLAKRDVPNMVYDEIESKYNQLLLRSFNMMSRSRTVSKLRKFLNEDGNHWVDIEKLLKDPGGFRDSIDAIGDFLKRAKYREAYDTMCADVGDGNEIAPQGKPCIIKKYDDGFFWFSRGGRSCEIFGEEGRNCGGGNYTLIDLQRKIKRGDQSKRSWFIGLDYEVGFGVLHQILGFGNSFPMEKYWPYIKDFIDNYDVVDIDPKVFEYLAQNSKVSEEEIMKFIMAVGNDNIKRNWSKRAEEKGEARDDILDDIMARQLAEFQQKMQKNLALKSPVEIDENKAHAVNQWYKNKRGKIK